jgi:hypothetical protein
MQDKNDDIVTPYASIMVGITVEVCE